MRSFRLVANSLLSIYLASSCTLVMPERQVQRICQAFKRALPPTIATVFTVGERLAGALRPERINGDASVSPFGTRIRHQSEQ